MSLKNNIYILDSCQLGFYDLFKDGIGAEVSSQLFAEAEAGAVFQLSCACQAVSRQLGPDGLEL